MATSSGATAHAAISLPDRSDSPPQCAPSSKKSSTDVGPGTPRRSKIHRSAMAELVGAGGGAGFDMRTQDQRVEWRQAAPQHGIDGALASGLGKVR